MTERIIEHVIGVRQDTNEQRRPLFFWTDQVLLCSHHTRGMRLQPFTTVDREAGFGKHGCAFCPGGQLAGTYAQHRSQKALTAALEAVKA